MFFETQDKGKGVSRIIIGLSNVQKSVIIDDQSFPTGMGLDKKSAEQTAAKIALEQLDAPF